MMLTIILVLLLSYLIGCFNTGYYYTRLFYKQDIREIGTKVTGAYNVSRLTGKRGFIITFLGDSIKGAIAVALCRWLKFDDLVVLLSVFCVLSGHIFPFQLKFRGGKGFSTAFGAFLAFHPAFILYWAITAGILRLLISSYTIAVLFALTLLPLELFVLDYSTEVVLLMILDTLLIIYACRSNLIEFISKRAFQGTKKRK